VSKGEKYFCFTYENTSGCQGTRPGYWMDDMGARHPDQPWTNLAS